MQKHKSVVFFFLLFAVLGFVFGTIFTDGEIASIRISKITALDLFEMVCLCIVSICVVFDFVKIDKDKKKFGQIKNNIKNLYITRTRLGAIILACVVIFEVIIFAFNPTLIIFLLTLMAAEFAVWFFYRNTQRNGVNENGILFWGVYYPWEKIKSYTIEASDHFSVVVSQKVFEKKYDEKLRFKVSSIEYSDVSNLIKESVISKN